MSKFVGRHRELEELNQIFSRHGEQFIQVFYAFFARARFTDTASKETMRVNGMLVDLGTLDKDLKEL